MNIDKIREMLEKKFSVEPSLEDMRRVIFWYDETGSFTEEIENLNITGVKILKMEKIERKGEMVYSNLFHIKYSLEIEDRESNYLVYSPFEKPDIYSDILMDIELYSEEFKAETSTLLLEELNLNSENPEVEEMIKKNQQFFRNSERKNRFLTLVEENPTLDKVRLGMIGSLTKSANSSFETIIKDLFSLKGEEKLKEVEKWIGLEVFKETVEENLGLEFKSLDNLFKTLVVTHFFYSLKDKRVPEELKEYFAGKLNNIYIFIENWLNDKSRYEEYLSKVEIVEKELKIKNYLEIYDTEKLLSVKTFSCIDEYLIEKIVSLIKGRVENFDQFIEWIKIREDITPWLDKNIEIYNCLYRACKILKYRKNFIVSETDIFKGYREKYWKIDSDYRKFYLAYDRVVKTDSLFLEELRKEIEFFYVNTYMKLVNNSWIETLKEKKENYPKQRDFYEKYVEKSQERVIVFISDGLRYEVAEQLKKELLISLKSSVVTLEGVVSELPSYTKLGMSALLPHENRLNYRDGNIYVGELPTASSEARERILKLKNENSCVISYDRIFSRDSLRESIKGKEVVYIYHNVIDATGDKQPTENAVFESCEKAVTEIRQGINFLINNIGSLKVYITSDHGFIYQRDVLEEYEKLEAPKKYLEKNRRYVLTEEKEIISGTVTLDLGEVFKGVYGVFPRDTYRFKVSGGGSNYVHGGISLQETVVPVLSFKFSKGNILEKRKVDTVFTNHARKITSLETKFNFYQKEGVNPNKGILEKTLKIGIYIGGNLISDEKTLNFNSKIAEEYKEILTLKALENENVHNCILKIKDGETNELVEEIEFKISLGLSESFWN